MVPRSVIPHLLGKLDVKPALLHGDLWVRRLLRLLLPWPAR